MRFIPLLLTGLLALAASMAQARDFKAGSIEVADPWSRATPRGASAGAGYMKITNTGHDPRPAGERILGYCPLGRASRDEHGERHRQDAAAQERA